LICFSVIPAELEPNGAVRQGERNIEYRISSKSDEGRRRRISNIEQGVMKADEGENEMKRRK
jgi:hypothetical protein